MEQITITVNRTIELSSLSRTKINKMIRTGELDSVVVGRRRLVKVASLRAMLEAA